MRIPAAIAVSMLVACGSVAAQPQQYASGASGWMPRYRSGCVHELQAFVQELSTAVEVNDVNRLAALYRWNGTSSRAGYDLMHRLETIAARPLLQVVAVYPVAGDDVDDGFPEALMAPPAASVAAAPPVGLRLEQTLADGTTPASTTLWLRRDLGCWWVTL